MKPIKHIVILIISICMPFVQTEAALTTDFIAFEDAFVGTTQSHGSGSQMTPQTQGIGSQRDLERAGAGGFIIGKGAQTHGTTTAASQVTEPIVIPVVGATTEGAKPIESALQEELLEEAAAAEESEADKAGAGFWNRRKVIGFLLFAGLVGGILAIVFGASGSGGGGGGGGGSPSNAPGGPVVPLVPDNPIPPDPPIIPGPGPIPHAPEPSTFALLGLGLLIPFLRKRKA